MNQFDAAPGSAAMVYSKEGSFDHAIPILGWVYVSGNRADPIMPIACPISPLVGFCIPLNDKHDAYLHPHTNRVFGDGREFDEHMSDFAEEWAKRGVDAKERVEHVDEANRDKWETEGVATKFAKEIAADPEIKEMFEGKADTRPLHFGEKTFKQQSFWHWPDANCVFAIPGESALPSDPRVLKITGDEFRELKREGADVIDPHNGVTIEQGPTEEPPPAKPKRDVSDAI